MGDSPNVALPVPGSLVWIRQRRWRVERATRNRGVLRLDVAARTERRTFLAPFDRARVLESGRRRHARRQALTARLAGAIGRSADRRLPLAMIDADVDILPHQLEPALAVLAGHARLLIADQVGLGKTIQAGLIVAEIVRREAAPRILILVPASLRDQWSTELGLRFSVTALRADRLAIQALAREGAYGANPWETPGVWIASFDFLKQPQIIHSLPMHPWDLVVIDEAHVVCGDSERHDACRTIAGRARRVVLLTATPHSGDTERFDRLLALGDLGGAEKTTVFRRTRRDVGIARVCRVRWHGVTLSNAEQLALDELENFERAALTASSTHRENTRLLLSVFRKRALSTFAALSRSLSNRLAWLGGEQIPVPEWRQTRLLFDGEEQDAAELAHLSNPIDLDSRRERSWLRRLKLLADDASATESKIRRLVGLLERSAEPVVVFTEFRDSLEAIHDRLRRSRVVAVVHGGQDAAEQRAELGRYIRGPASVLLATDVAGQGLNLQSRGRWVISLELPWNPARLEQRLGRVDRIGQARAPHFTLLIARHDSERGLLSHLARRVLTAQSSFSSDALREVIPPESEVRETLFPAREPASVPRGTVRGATEPAELQRRSRFHRAGIVAARNLTLRRRMARRWRSSEHDLCRIVISRARGRRSVLVCSRPILDGNGEVIDRRLIAVAFAAHVSFNDGDPALRLAVQRLIARPALRRLRKSRRQIEAATRRAVAREADIAAQGTPPPRGDQLALFTNEMHRQADARHAEEQDWHARSRDRVNGLRQSAAVTLGAVEIHFILERGR